VPNAFLSVFSNENAAQTVVNARPMRYRLLSDATANAAHETQKNIGAGKTDTQEKGEETNEQEKVFELHISPSQFDHEHHIANEPLFGPWTPIDRKHSFFGGGLEIPRSLMSSGLRDWETDGGKWRNVGDEVDGSGAILEGLGVRNLGANGSGKDGVNTQWRVDQRRKKRLQQLKEGVMGGLKRYSDQTAKERGMMSDDQRSWNEGKKGQSRKKEMGFGFWPGKNFKDVQRAKDSQKSKPKEVGPHESNPDVWPMT